MRREFGADGLARFLRSIAPALEITPSIATAGSTIFLSIRLAG
jgi:hypothetical protein